MKAKIKITKEVDIKWLLVQAKVRYWEDTEVNGVADEDGLLIPCRKGDVWSPQIDIDTGIILGWPAGTTASIHYKVCDQCFVSLIGDEGIILEEKDSYVPRILCPEENGYGDYIIMKVQDNGYIPNWNPTLEGIVEDEE